VDVPEEHVGSEQRSTLRVWLPRPVELIRGSPSGPTVMEEWLPSTSGIPQDMLLAWEQSGSRQWATSRPV
jgi:hypothetical protein